MNIKELSRFDLKNFDQKHIRNFSIIAHIDHGKSTLADRLLEVTGTISERERREQILDKLQVERERGITVKAQTASLFYEYKGEVYLLNLIDTPGHVDFNYEVSRSLAACQGVLLLVDAVQGVQAQTMANFYLAFEQDLVIIPVVNKIDLPAADPERVIGEMGTVFDIEAKNVILASAKSGKGISEILGTLIERITPPKGEATGNFKALLFDSWYDEYRGVVCLITVIDGAVFKGDIIMTGHTEQKYEVLEIGLMYPDPYPLQGLYTGQVGYVICGMKTIRDAQVGDTFYHAKKPVALLPGFKPAKPMVFAGIYPVDASELTMVSEAIEKLTLNDPSVRVEKENSAALGLGFRCGFLGLLHMDVFKQRLEQEYNVSIIVTSPTVPYRVVLNDGTEVIVDNPSKFPDQVKIHEILEPVIKATIVTPKDYLGAILTLCQERRGSQTGMSYMDDKRMVVYYTLPLNEVVVDFYDKLKSISAGYASFDYEEAGYVESDLVKMNIMLNGKPVDALSVIVHNEKAYYVGRQLVKKLKEVIPRQLFEIAIQAAIGAKVIARESISALRKNVTAKCYGGDISRKRKLLEKQKAGKKKMKQIGNVELPQEAFLTVLKDEK